MPKSVSRRGVAPVVVAGGIVASASTGALIAMGRRLGSIRLPFAAIGATLAHATSSSETTALVLVGFVCHVLLSFMWAVAFVFSGHTWLAVGERRPCRRNCRVCAVVGGREGDGPRTRLGVGVGRSNRVGGGDRGVVRGGCLAVCRAVAKRSGFGRNARIVAWRNANVTSSGTRQL